jgi:hypothetical protein
MDGNDRIGIGGNNPPDPLILEADERIDAANRLLTETTEVTDMETADKVNFFAGQIQATWKALDDQRLQEGRDFDAAQAKKYRTPLQLLLAAKAKVVALRVAFLKKREDELAEQKRQAEAEAKAIADRAAAAAAKAEAEAKKKGGDPLRAEQEARRLAQEAEDAREAAAAAPTRAQITGAYSARATGLRDVWSAEVEDLSAAFKHYNKKGTGTKAALEKVIRECIGRLADADAKLLKDEAKAPPGIKFIKERK